MGKSGVEVEGGHIVRGSGGKDRHSKVCTAKGPRDRRVRLAAHTAIQFYDVQDRLGYDRPSKAVDWLIHKAKSAIDRLAHPTDVGAWSLKESESVHRHDEFEFECEFVGSTFLPPSLDSDAFFPEASSDLRLSLHHHQQQQQQNNPTNLEAWAGWNGGGDGYLLGQNQFISQWGTLQSSNTHPLQAWMDPINPFASSTSTVLLKLINFLRPAKGVGKATHPSPSPSMLVSRGTFG